MPHMRKTHSPGVLAQMTQQALLSRSSPPSASVSATSHARGVVAGRKLATVAALAAAARPMGAVVVAVVLAVAAAVMGGSGVEVATAVVVVVSSAASSAALVGLGLGLG